MNSASERAVLVLVDVSVIALVLGDVFVRPCDWFALPPADVDDVGPTDAEPPAEVDVLGPDVAEPPATLPMDDEPPAPPAPPLPP